MTYNEIISQVAQRLGYNGFANSLKADFRYALKWAEGEMVRYISLTKKVVSFPMTPATAIGSALASAYELPDDLSYPRQFRFIDSNGNEIQSVETELEEYLHWNPNPDVPPTANDFLPQSFTTDTTIENARLGNRIVYLVMYDDEKGWTLQVKPTTPGTIELLYIPGTNLDPFDKLTNEPPFPELFHHYLVAGAIKYLAPIERGRKIALNDYNAAAFYKQIGDSASLEWQQVQEKTREQVQSRNTVAKIKMDAWYDNPRKYR